MKIIAVDDEKAALSILVEEIKKVVSKANVHAFSLPEDAINYIKKNDCDIAFLDVEMPQMSGIALAKKLKKYNKNLNIIFVTAYRNYGIEAIQLRASGYLLKPATAEGIQTELESLRYELKAVKSGVYISCFGKFEVTKDGEQVHFGRAKAQELLACLVDCHGQAMTKKEIAAVLFEDELYSRKIQDYMNKIIKELEHSLENAGIKSLFVKKRNYYALDLSQFRCDLYEYEEGNPVVISKFRGEYMKQYSWAEDTLGRLYSDWVD